MIFLCVDKKQMEHVTTIHISELGSVWGCFARPSALLIQ